MTLCSHGKCDEKLEAKEIYMLGWVPYCLKHYCRRLGVHVSEYKAYLKVKKQIKVVQQIEEDSGM